MAPGTAMYSRIPTEKCRLRGEKFGSMRRNISQQRAKTIHMPTITMRRLLRLMSRESSRENGMSQWKMKSKVKITPQWPRIRSRYQEISSGELPDQIIRNWEKFK